MKPRTLLDATLLVLAVALLGVGVVYVLTQCQHIPSPLPGREAGSTDHRFGYAAVAFALALLMTGGAAWSGRGRLRPRRAG